MPFVTRRRAMLATAATLTMGGAARPASAQAEGLGRLVESPPRPLPEGLSWTDGEGATATPADHAGKVMVINLWATWCAPCVAEMPALDRMAALLAAEGVVVLPLSSDRGGHAKVAPFYEQRGIHTLGIWLDPRGHAARAFAVRGLPTTVIVDRQGRERARLEGGAEWDQPPLLAAIRRLGGAAAPGHDATTRT